MRVNKIIMTSVITFLIIVGSLICFEDTYKNKNNNSINAETTSSMQVVANVIHASYNYNVKDLNETIKFMDCIFIGEVISINGYNYENPMSIEDNSGNEKVVYDTYTNYSIKVTKVLKGKVKSNKIISVQKRGGLEHDGKTISIIENDVLPDVGEKYIFFALKQDDGSLLLSGEASNISLNKLSKVKQELAK